MNQEVKRNKYLAAVLAIFFGTWGLHRFYMGKWDGVLYIIFSMTFIPQIVGFIEGIYYLTITDEKFQSKCNYDSAITKALDAKIQSTRTSQTYQTYRTAQSSQNNGHAHAHTYARTQVRSVNGASQNIPITNENRALAQEIEKAQDRLERMKSNDFYIQGNNLKIDKKKEREQLKELKEHGLISEEEYREKMRKL